MSPALLHLVCSIVIKIAGVCCVSIRAVQTTVHPLSQPPSYPIGNSKGSSAACSGHKSSCEQRSLHGLLDLNAHVLCGLVLAAVVLLLFTDARVC
jgi:hypothetical protein